MLQRLYQYFRDLNLFEVERVRWNGFDRSAYTIATRLYILLVLLSLTVLIFFVAFDIQRQSIIVRNPSQSTFFDLHDRYSSTLLCPCRKMTIPFGSFTSITTSYHPICNSVFVSDRWINLMFSLIISFYFPLDFRSTALGHFQLLASLCSLTRRFVDDAIDDFSSDTFLTQVVLSKKSLDLKVQTLHTSMQTSTINSFRHVLELLRKSTFSNQLQTGLQTSVLQAYYGFNSIGASAIMSPGTFSDGPDSVCRCTTLSTCTSSLIGFFDIFGVNTRGQYFVLYDLLLANVTGFVAGCYPIESLLKSTLQCLFDASCLFKILEYFPHGDSAHFNPLNSSQTKFSPQSTMDSLLGSLLIEHWSFNVSFENYYDECAPILCTYVLNERASLLYIITQLLGFYGGLTMTLRIVIPRIVLAVFNHYKSRHRRPQATVNQVPLLRRIRGQMLELNLFRTREERNDLYELQTSRLATRIFFILTFLCVLVLSIYTIAMVRSQTIIIVDPSETTFREISSKYSATLRCPCDRIAIEYETFVDLSPRYHSVCSSQFIGSAWISSLSASNWLNQLFTSRDFRLNGPVFFSTLSNLCNLIASTVSNYWFVFKQASCITEEVLTDTQLMIRASDTLNLFKSETLTEFKRVLLMIQFQTSTLLAMGSQNYEFPLRNFSNPTETMDFYTKPSIFGNCSCALNDRCSTPVGFYNITIETAWSSPQSKFDIPQLFTGCFVLQSTLQSSLQCFFNQTCLDIIQSEIISPKSINISILQSNHSRFQPETLVGELVDELMIEDWGESINYSKYYARCQPKQCSYTITSHSSISFIVAFLLGLCGGVIAALKIIVPIIVRFLRRKFHRRLGVNLAPDQATTTINGFRHVLRSIPMKILGFNLFETELSWNDPVQQHYEITSTRIHFVLLTITFSIMIFYTAYTMQTQTVTINHPSDDIFKELQSNDVFLSTLSCPCQNITIPYQSFTSISFQLHQLCSSDFIRDNSMWMNMVYTAMISELHPYLDYRMFALLHFRLLSLLCQLTDEIITDAVKRFNMNELISGQVEFREFFVTKTNTALAQLRTSTAREFVRTLDFTRSITQGNGIVSATLSNWQFISFDQINFNTLWTLPRFYGDPPNCSCATSSMCTSLATIDGAIVPGFRVGCYALDSLLQSTLECLYDRNCLTMIQSLNSSMNFTITPLNSNLSSPNATVQSLIDDLFINEWKTNVSYEKYYESCAPLFCSYSINQRADLIYIVTASIGFYGGLSTAIRIIAPMMAKIGRSIWIFYQTRRIRSNVIAPIPLNN